MDISLKRYEKFVVYTENAKKKPPIFSHAEIAE